MKKIIKYLIIFYIIFILVKTILVYFIPTSSAFSDGYFYSKAARSIFYFFEFSVHGNPLHGISPLYPLFLSVSYIFKDMNLVYFTMKFINVLLSSLIIFPTYLLAKEFLTKKKSLLLAVLVGVLPSNLIFSSYIMAENLFYPLFMFSIYFIYKSFKEKSYKWDILAGIFIALSYLTKTRAIILIGILILAFILKIILNKEDFSFQLKKKAILVLFLILVLAPWFIRNGLIFGFTFSGLFGTYSSIDITLTQKSFPIFSFIGWFVIYLGYIILTTGVLFAIASLFTLKSKNRNLLFFSIFALISILSVIFIATFHNIHPSNSLFVSDFDLWEFGDRRPAGRYIDMVLPIIFILGFIGINLYKKNKEIYSKYLKKIIIIAAIILAFSAQLVFYQLFPINNSLLTHIGAINYIIQSFSSPMTSFIIFSTLFFITPFIFLILFKKDKLKLKKIYLIYFLFFIMISILSYGATYYNSNIWDDKDQIQLGKWFNSYDKDISTVLFDDRYEGRLEKNKQTMLYQQIGNKTATVMGFWMNDKIIIGDISAPSDYIVTKEELNLPLIKKKGEFYIYKNTK